MRVINPDDGTESALIRENAVADFNTSRLARDLPLVTFDFTYYIGGLVIQEIGEVVEEASGM